MNQIVRKSSDSGKTVEVAPESLEKAYMLCKMLIGRYGAAPLEVRDELKEGAYISNNFRASAAYGEWYGRDLQLGFRGAKKDPICQAAVFKHANIIADSLGIALCDRGGLNKVQIRNMLCELVDNDKVLQALEGKADNLIKLCEKVSPNYQEPSVRQDSAIERLEHHKA